MNHEQSNFYTLKQDGPFATRDFVDLSRVFIPDARDFVASLSGLQRTQYRTMKNEAFTLLEVRNFQEIDSLKADPEKLREVSNNAYTMIGKMYGIEGSLSEIKSEVNGYATTADNVIEHLKENVLNGQAVRVEMVNEIQAKNDPVELLLIAFDNRYAPKPRFEAVRKLELMKLIASIKQREKETNIEHNFSGVIEFMNKFVWSNDYRIGDFQEVALLSKHDKDTYGATNVTVQTREEAKDYVLEPNEKQTPISRRRIIPNGHEIFAYSTIRGKSEVAKVIKLLRKNEQNPAIAVDDELGIMVVLNSKHDIKLFLNHLSQSVKRAGSHMTIEDISDTLDGSAYNGKAGSSNGVQMLKFFVKMGGMRVEFVVHTNKTFIDSLYKRNVSHAEYEIKRVFDSGVIDLLFPQSIYKIDAHLARERALKKRRRDIENEL